MKVCYLILCHQYSNNMKKMIDYLIINQNDVVIHIDKKSNLNDFNNLNKKVKIIEDRVNVRWGHFSQVQAMLKLFKVGLERKSDFYCLISGDTLLVKSDSEIKDFFSKNKNKNFISLASLKSETIKRVKFNYESEYFFTKNRTLLQKLWIKLRIRFNLLEKNKKYKNIKIYKGSQWFSLNNETVNYIIDYLDLNSDYLCIFEKSYCPDEIFFQTLLIHSDLKNTIYKFNSKNEDEMNLFYIDWTEKTCPKNLGLEDIEKVKEKNYIFARKFSDNIEFEEIQKKLNIY